MDSAFPISRKTYFPTQLQVFKKGVILSAKKDARIPGFENIWKKAVEDHHLVCNNCSVIRKWSTT